MPFVSWSLSLKPRTSCQSARLPSSAPPSTATNPAPLNPAKPHVGLFLYPKGNIPMDPKFPSIAVELSNTDGNAYMIMGAVLRALRRAEVDEHTITEFC